METKKKTYQEDHGGDDASWEEGVKEDIPGYFLNQDFEECLRKHGFVLGGLLSAGQVDSIIGYLNKS